MQPSTPQRPVMDIAAPAPAPAAPPAPDPLAVRPAPTTSDGSPTAVDPEAPAAAPNEDSAQPHPKATILPVGLILATVVVMLLLAGLAIIVYVTNHPA